MKLSYSQIDTYQQCPQAYKLRYREGLRPAPGLRQVAGSALHAALAYFHHPSRLQAPPEEEVLAVYAEQFKVAGLSDDEQKLAHFEHGLEVLRRYWQEHREDQRRTADVERNFLVPLEGEVALSGRIDRIDVAGPEALELVDFKSGAKLPDQAQVDDDLQMALYCLAGRQLFPGKQITPRLHYVSWGVTMTPRVTEERLEVARLGALKAAQEIGAGYFAPRVGPHCDWCEVKAACEMFRTPGAVPAETDPAELLRRCYEVGREKASLEREHEQLKARVRELLEQAQVSQYRAGGYVARLNRMAKKVYDMGRLRQVLEPLGLFERVVRLDSGAYQEIAPALEPKTRALVDGCCTRQEGSLVLQVKPEAGADPEDEQG
jgi:RecB family exonuclease